MDIGKAFSFVFEDEKWISKVLLGGLIEMAQQFEGPDAVKLQFRFKARGDALLAEREKTSRLPQTPA